jgi:hypothetical protein
MNPQSKQVWVVVRVASGVPVLADVFSDPVRARACEARHRRRLRPDYDEVGVFETTLRSSERQFIKRRGKR